MGGNQLASRRLTTGAGDGVQLLTNGSIPTGGVGLVTGKVRTPIVSLLHPG
jgi:hypothetical protein